MCHSLAIFLGDLLQREGVVRLTGIEDDGHHSIPSKPCLLDGDLCRLKSEKDGVETENVGLELRFIQRLGDQRLDASQIIRSQQIATDMIQMVDLVKNHHSLCICMIVLIHINEALILYNDTTFPII